MLRSGSRRSSTRATRPPSAVLRANEPDDHHDHQAHLLLNPGEVVGAQWARPLMSTRSPWCWWAPPQASSVPRHCAWGLMQLLSIACDA